MPNVAVITDSISCLPSDIIERFQIHILPINLYFGEKVYKDWMDTPPSEAYELFQKDPESFATSAPSPGDCFEAYREASKRVKDVLVVTVSSRLSMVYQSAQIAREQAKEELPGTTIEVMDSYLATAGEGLVALAGARATKPCRKWSRLLRM